MTPAALSQVTEGMFRVVTTLILAYVLRPRGMELGSAGAASGPVTGLVYVVHGYYRLQAPTRRPSTPALPAPTPTA